MTSDVPTTSNSRRTVRTWALNKLLTALICVPTVAVAGGSTGDINISSVNLQIISYSTQQLAYLYTTVPGAGCTNSTPVLIMDSTNPLGPAMYATLLAAKTSGKNVNISTSGCTSAGYPIIVSIYFDT